MENQKKIRKDEILMAKRPLQIERMFEAAVMLGYRYFQHNNSIYEVHYATYWDITKNEIN